MNQIDFRKIAAREGVKQGMFVCGNCTHYIWGKAKRGVHRGMYDKSSGSCLFQIEEILNSIADFKQEYLKRQYGDLIPSMSTEYGGRILKFSF